ncbi:MAG: alpha/beta hydrolase [Spirochaetota bacterium]
MRFSTLASTTRVLEMGRRIELPGGPHAVLLLHGWTGWPGRVAPLAEALNQAGHTVVVPRLPGHGTSMADMLQTNADDWLRRAIDEYLDLSDRFDHVDIAGTSMGAILATIVASVFDIDRVALLAPAFLNRDRRILLAPFLKRIIRRIPGDWNPDQETDPRTVEIGKEYATYTYTPMASELLRLQRRGRRALAGLTAETLVIVSLADESVPPRVAELIRRKSSARKFKLVVVERSNHQICEHVEREAVAEAVVEWFAERR